MTAENYPEWRSYSNLAFGYKASRSIKLIIENYRKVLQLNPGNQNALKSLLELKKKKQIK